MKKVLIVAAVATVVISGLAVGLYGLYYWQIIPQKSYTAEDFNIAVIRSTTDADGDGVDDSTDMLQGARAYLQTEPKYQTGFYKGGYPPEGAGMSADVIWKAFDSAGYSLKDMMDRDIAENADDYPFVNARPQPDVDFRRVRNLHAFFKRFAVSLTTDTAQIEEWQPGDIVVVDGDIALVSDRRNRRGVPYILHLSGQPVLEEDAILRYEVVGHYRWDGWVDR